MSFSRKEKGFTLIELLVVVSIILIASSIIFTIGKTGVGQSLSISQRIVSGLVQGARAQALLKSSKVRLIIHNDPSEIDKYRRLVGIMYQGADASGADGWIAANQGTYLPEGIYFDAASSAAESGSSWSVSNVFNVEFPLLTAQAGSSGKEFYYYEFDSNGTLESPNPWLVLRAAVMIPGADGVDELRINEDLEYLRSALILRRSGSTTLVEEPEAIDDSGGSIDK